jgi:hypothetical protein
MNIDALPQSITFGEHVGLVGAFLYVAWRDLAARRRGAPP